jgi:nucleotide sugar dehydrogenase
VLPKTVDNKVCVLGLGYVGLTLSAVMADVGYEVTGVEIRERVVEMTMRAEPHFHEPGLGQMLRRVIEARRLNCVTRIPQNCDASVFIITVGTPLAADGKARLDMVESVAREVANRVKDGSLVIMRSTVKLGTTQNLVIPILEASGKRIQIAFCPERTIEGHALRELRSLPQIVGADDTETAMRAAQIFSFLTPTVVRVSSLRTAEMIKLVDNVQRDVHFAFANEVAAMCDAVGVGAAEVIQAGKLGYPRTNLPMPGPVGGPCLSKDPYIFAEGLAAYGAVPNITLAARKTNEDLHANIPRLLASLAKDWANFPADPVITLAGLAFKGRPATDDLRGTTAKPIFDELMEVFPAARFRGFDAVVPASEIQNFGIEPAASLEGAFEGAHLVLLLNNHPVFEAMPVAALAERMARPGLIYDLWNNFKASDLEMPKGTGYMTLGGRGVSTLPP